MSHFHNNIDLLYRTLDNSLQRRQWNNENKYLSFNTPLSIIQLCLLNFFSI